LQVDGTTTTINSTTMTVDDLNITLASGAANAAAADGAGITVDGASATLTYNGTNDDWNFNKTLNVTGNLTSTGIDDNASSTAITIDSSQRVGIGTDSPAETLHVENASNNAILLNAPANRYNAIGFQSAGTDKWWLGRADSDQIAGDAFFIGADAGNAIDPGGLSAKLVINSSGNVGIGDTTPENKLTVVDTDAGSGIAPVKARTTTVNGRASYQIGNDADNWFMGIDGGNSDAFFISDAVGSSDRLVITQGGNVGIGTTSPRNDAATTNLSISSSGVARLLLDNTAASGREYGFYSSSAGLFALYDYDAAAERIVCDSSGNVGIGTNSPSYPLDVVGSMRIRHAGSDLFATIRGPSNRDLRIDIDANGDADSFVVRDLRDGSERFKVQAGGNVGIGTTSPVRQLSIEKNGTALASLVNTAGGSCQLLFGDSVSDTQGRVLYDNNGDYLTLYANGSEYMRIDAYGGLNIKSVGGTQAATFGGSNLVNGITALPSSAGTPFVVGRDTGSLKSATFAGHVNINTGYGLSFDSGANYLDDYEEGTFTPSFDFAGGNGTASFTFSNATGRYTKIGNVCYYSIDLRFNSFSKGTASGNPRLTNLPFMPANYADYNRGQISINAYQYPYTTTAGHSVVGSTRQNGSVNKIDLFRQQPNAANANLDDPDANSMLFVSGWYHTT